MAGLKYAGLTGCPASGCRLSDQAHSRPQALTVAQGLIKASTQGLPAVPLFPSLYTTPCHHQVLPTPRVPPSAVISPAIHSVTPQPHTPDACISSIASIQSGPLLELSPHTRSLTIHHYHHYYQYSPWSIGSKEKLSTTNRAAAQFQLLCNRQPTETNRPTNNHHHYEFAIQPDFRSYIPPRPPA